MYLVLPSFTGFYRVLPSFERVAGGAGGPAGGADGVQRSDHVGRRARRVGPQSDELDHRRHQRTGPLDTPPPLGRSRSESYRFQRVLLGSIRIRRTFLSQIYVAPMFRRFFLWMLPGFTLVFHEPLMFTCLRVKPSRHFTLILSDN